MNGLDSSMVIAAPVPRPWFEMKVEGFHIAIRLQDSHMQVW